MKRHWKKIIAGILIIAVFFFVNPFQVHAGQLYCSPVTVAGGQVPSTQTNFPAVIKPTDNRFKTTGSGGHVANANGYDIRPYTDSSCTTAITGYELVPGTYNASTGTFEMWVNVSSISNGTVIYLGYGDAGISTDGSSTSTWDSHYLVVYHLPNGTALTANDSTSNANTGVISGATAATGQIDGGANFNTSLSWKVTTTNNIQFPSVSFTAEAWIKRTGQGGWVEQRENGANTGRWAASIGDGAIGHVLTVYSDKSGFQNGSTNPTDGTWNHMVVVSKSGSADYYLNGAVDTTGAGAILDGGSFTPSNNVVKFGFTDTGAGGVDGVGDEFRLSDSERTASWIATEYNNMLAPNTFWTLGTENTLGGGAIVILPPATQTYITNARVYQNNVIIYN